MSTAYRKNSNINNESHKNNKGKRNLTWDDKDHKKIKINKIYKKLMKMDKNNQRMRMGTTLKLR